MAEAGGGAEREGGDGQRDQQGAADDGTRGASGRHQDQVRETAGQPGK